MRTNPEKQFPSKRVADDGGVYRFKPGSGGMVSDPAEYRWSSYGEAIGGEAKGHSAKACRERFSAKRTSGAHKMRGAGAAAAGVIWSARDLKVGIGNVEC